MCIFATSGCLLDLTVGTAAITNSFIYILHFSTYLIFTYTFYRKYFCFYVNFMSFLCDVLGACNFLVVKQLVLHFLNEKCNTKYYLYPSSFHAFSLNGLVFPCSNHIT